MTTFSQLRAHALRPIQHVAPLAIVAAALLLPVQALAAGSCHLNSARGDIQHVIYIQFDNTHLRRDNPEVPSDLEQMPHLLDFIRDNGTLLGNDHTVLISHTAGGILSSLTGLYPDRHGQTVSNGYVRTSSTGAFSFPSSFGYWTDPVSAANTATVPNMVGPDGTNIPAPWVPFTRAGCDVGAIATANIVLENTGTGPTGDVTKVFGNPSPQYTEAAASAAAPAGSAARAKAQTDLVGFAIHCAQGSATCAAGQVDLLPAEPGGYNGFKALFGAQAINPLLTGQPSTSPLIDLLGNPITDPYRQPGFPGFDGMSAAVSLAYVAAMQERGIPVTYAYISDAHDFHGIAGSKHVAFGPGDAGYVAQLKAYDDAFAAFFDRLAADGITKNNALFVFTVDEGDHFVGVQKSGCDGVTTPCIYGPNEVGEINTNVDTLIAQQFPTLAAQFLGTAAPNAFTVHGDDAPPFYLASERRGPAHPDRPGDARFRANDRQPDRGQSLHRRDRYADDPNGGSGRHEGHAHVRDRRSGAECDVRLFRGSRLFHHRLSCVDLRNLHQSAVRVEPRKYPARNRPDLAWFRGAGCARNGHRGTMDRPYRCAADDARAGGASGRLPARRPDDRGAPVRLGRAAGLARAPRDIAEARRGLQAGECSVRSVRDVGPRRFDRCTVKRVCDRRFAVQLDGRQHPRR